MNKLGFLRKHPLLLLHLLLVVYSFSSVCAKFSSNFEVLSPGFIISYVAMVALLGVYALGWQQVIKWLPLTFAYANRAVTVAWGIVWGFLFFREEFTLRKVLGAGIVLVGVALFATAERDEESSSAEEGCEHE